MNAFKLGFWVFFTIALISALVSLITLNQDTITISFFRYTSQENPKWLVLISCLLLGAVFSSLFFVVQLIVLETRNIRLRRANRQLERALAQYNPAAAKSVNSAHTSAGPTVGNPSATVTGLTGPLDPALEDEV